MYQLSRTVPVNEPGKVFLSRHDVWTGLMMKARNALPYVPQMQKCEVVEQDEDWLIRDIMLNNVPLRERVTFEPENRVIFERIGGVELGRIENIIGEDDKGNQDFEQREAGCTRSWTRAVVPKKAGTPWLSKEDTGFPLPRK